MHGGQTEKTIPDILVDLQELALASRLRRLSASFMTEAADLYHEAGIEFRPRWFPVFYALGQDSPRSITELAQALGMTHPAISQVAAELHRRGLICPRRDRRDDRRRLWSLSAKGERTRRQLAPVWQAIRAAAREFLAEAGIDLLAAVTRIEKLHAERSVAERARERLGMPPQRIPRIVDYRPAYKKHYRALNEAWLQEYFSLTETDRRNLDDPNRRILRKGGHILFALYGDQVAGTCTLVRHPGGDVELCKLTVAAALRGRGIGRALAGAAIGRARDMGAPQLYLRTSPRLKAATRLYRKLGFRRQRSSPLPPPDRDRRDRVMKLDLPTGSPPTTQEVLR